MPGQQPLSSARFHFGGIFAPAPSHTPPPLTLEPVYACKGRGVGSAQVTGTSPGCMPTSPGVFTVTARFLSPVPTFSLPTWYLLCAYIEYAVSVSLSDPSPSCHREHNNTEVYNDWTLLLSLFFGQQQKSGVFCFFHQRTPRSEHPVQPGLSRHTQ